MYVQLFTDRFREEFFQLSKNWEVPMKQFYK